LKQTMIGIAPRGQAVPAAVPQPQPVIAPPPAISNAPQHPLVQTLPSATPDPDAPAWGGPGPQSPLAPGPGDAWGPPGHTEGGTWVPAGVAPRDPAAGAGLKRTMVGYGAPMGGPPRGPAPAPAPVPAPQNFGSTLPINAGPTGGQPLGGQPLGGQPLGGTMIHAGPEFEAPPAPAPKAGNLNRTMLGVARPGIAPVHPGIAQASAPPAPDYLAPPPYIEAARAPQPYTSGYAPTTEAPLPQNLPPAPQPVAARPPTPDRAPPVPAKKTSSKGAIILLAVAAALAVTAGVVAFLWEAPRPLGAEVKLDDRGAEQLFLTCDDCPDGTTVSLGGAQGTFKGKSAAIPLAKPLEVGKNELTVALHRPGLGRDEEVKLPVGVDYRVRGDLTALSEDPPKVKVLVQAAAGATAVVDGKPLALDANGRGEYAAEVARDLEGPADSILPFERKLPYSIALPGGQPRQGEVTLRFGIAPLRIVAPGYGIVIENETFMLSGRTVKDGRVTVSGRPITVDSEGRFAQLMNVSAVGETTVVVRAEAKDHAPRLVRVRVRRVASLKETAAGLRQTSLSDYPSIAAGAKPGSRIAIDGEVLESRIDGDVTLLLLDVKKGCSAAPCLTRVVHGARFDAKRGATVGAFGQFLSLVDGPRTGVKIPEIAADFLVPAAPLSKTRR
jgi:hypothetical protein